MNRIGAALVLLVLVATAGATDRALLVGCTEYPNLRGHRFYESAIRLRGPIHDVELMRETLKDHLGVPPENITVLVGWKDGAKDNPTRANILAALDRLAKASAKGDRVVVLMAGHGSRQPDASGDEPDGLDEIFLPADAKGWNGGVGAVENAIPDDELAAKILAIRDRGAVVCLLMDCCHAGTMVRGLEEAERSRRIDPSWLGVPPTPSRAAGATASTFEDMEGVAALYAAPAHRTAPELKLPRDAKDAQWHGLFSYMTAAALRRTRGATTFRELHAHIVAGYQALPYHNVAPVAEGDLDLGVMGGHSNRPPLWIRRDGDDVVLNAGRLSGIEPGTRLTVEVDGKTRTVTVAEADTTRSTCRKPDFEVPAGQILPATVESVPVGDLRIRIHVRCEGPRPAEVAACVGKANARFPVVDAPGDADWFLDVDGAGRVSLRPARTGSEIRFPVAPGDLKDSLERIFRVENLKRFAATNRGEGMPAGLEVRMLRRVKDAEKDAVVPVEQGSAMGPGDQFEIRLRNRSGEAWDVTILVLDAHYGVTELFPRRKLARVDARDTKERVLSGFSVTDASLGFEHLLVLAVPATGAEETWLGWLAHPPLDARQRAPETDPVKRLLRAVAFGGTTRGITFEKATLSMSLLTWRTTWGDLGAGGSIPTPSSIRVEPRHVPALLAGDRGEKQEVPTAWKERYRGDLSSLYRTVAPAVVVVRTAHGHGTGFLVDGKGTVLTNAHVVAGGFRTGSNGRPFVTVLRGDLDEEGWMAVREDDARLAEVVLVDEEKDLARLQVLAPPEWYEGMAPLALAEKPPSPGQEAVLVGHPAAGLLWSLREGRISQIGRMPHDLVDVLVARLAGTAKDEVKKLLAKNPVKIVLSDCRGNPGDSGSPLVDRRGRVLAITYAIPADPQKDKFVYHVHVDEVRRFLARDPEAKPLLPDAWKLGPRVGLAKSSDAGGYDLLIAGRERPEQILIDVNDDAKADPAKLEEIVAGSGFDAEAAFHFAPDRRIAFYDTDNDGTFDLILVDEDDDPEADVSYAWREGKWRVELDVGLHWLSSDHLRFKGGAEKAQAKFAALRKR